MPWHSCLAKSACTLDISNKYQWLYLCLYPVYTGQNQQTLMTIPLRLSRPRFELRCPPVHHNLAKMASLLYLMAPLQRKWLNNIEKEIPNNNLSLPGADGELVSPELLRGQHIFFSSLLQIFACNRDNIWAAAVGLELFILEKHEFV